MESRIIQKRKIFFERPKGHQYGLLQPLACLILNIYKRKFRYYFRIGHLVKWRDKDSDDGQRFIDYSIGRKTSSERIVLGPVENMLF